MGRRAHRAVCRWFVLCLHWLLIRQLDGASHQLERHRLGARVAAASGRGRAEDDTWAVDDMSQGEEGF